jgi:epoxyqueuosine reductase
LPIRGSFYKNSKVSPSPLEGDGWGEGHALSIEDQIKALVSNEEEYILGFANMKNLLDGKFKGYDFCIVIGKRLNDKIIDSIVTGPNQEYYDLYNETNHQLAELASKISNELKTHHISCIAVKPTISDEEVNDKYYQTLTWNFSHKMAATRAGLGWIGKTGLFVSEKFGPRLRLVSILVDHPLNCLKNPINESKCGNCNLCVDECPASAATGQLWNINVKRDEFFDAFKCRKKCRELSKKNIKKDVSLCGICVSVCPIGKKEFLTD